MNTLDLENEDKWEIVHILLRGSGLVKVPGNLSTETRQVRDANDRLRIYQSRLVHCCCTAVAN